MNKIIIGLISLTLLAGFPKTVEKSGSKNMVGCNGNACNAVELSWSKSGTAVFKYTAQWTNSIELKVWNLPSKAAVFAPCARYKKYKLKPGQKWDSGLKVLCKDFSAKINNDGKVLREGDFKF